MKRPRLLDGYSGAGGAGRGYQMAEFDIVGVDIVDQPRYPGRFIKTDFLTLSVEFLREFHLIHCSPPCQRYTSLRHAPGKHRDADLIGPTRELLVAAGVPYVIENVENARPWLRDPVLLCGRHFSLETHPYPTGWRLERHRLFETSFPVSAPDCKHDDRPVVGVYGGHCRDRRRDQGTNHKSGSYIPTELGFKAMGIDRRSMTVAEISDAIPPAYARYIAQTFLNSRSAHAGRDDDPVSAERGAGF